MQVNSDYCSPEKAVAEFYKGFAFERDVKGRLTIEGNTVPVFTGDDKTLAASARAYIDGSVELRARERQTAEHLRTLRSGKKWWNQWRLEHPEVHPMLAAHDFTEGDAGLVLDGYDFSYTNFTQARLRSMSLQGANFHQAILAKADLAGSHLEKSTSAAPISMKRASKGHGSAERTCRACSWRGRT